MTKVFKRESLGQALIRSYDEILSRWNTPYREVDIETTYGSTHCIVSGNPASPPLVMLHGVGDNSAVMWVFNAAELSRHFHCVAVDTVGGPGKSVPNQAYDESFSQVGWIAEVCDRLGLDHPSFLGVSNGAYMAFNYAVERSDLVRKVVCIEGGPVTNPLRSVFGTLMILFPEILIPTKGNLVRIMRKLSSPTSEVWQNSPWLTDHLILAMRSHNRKAMFRHRLQKYDAEKASRITGKTLFLFGADRVKRNQAYLDLLDNAGFQYTVVDGAGHGVNHEQPEATNRAIVAFLS